MALPPPTCAERRVVYQLLGNRINRRVAIHDPPLSYGDFKPATKWKFLYDLERRLRMAVQVPTPEQVKAAASEVGLSLTNEDIQSYIELIRPNVHAYNLVDTLPDYLPAVRYPRTPGSFPYPEDNTHNAWYV